MDHFAHFFRISLPIFTNKMKCYVKRWVWGLNRAWSREGNNKQAHTFIYDIPYGPFPLMVNSVHTIWHYKHWSSNTLSLWSGCFLWGFRPFYRHALIYSVSGLFDYKMVHCSKRCILRIIHSPAIVTKIYKSSWNGSKIATAGVKVGGNGLSLHL